MPDSTLARNRLPRVGLPIALVATALLACSGGGGSSSSGGSSTPSVALSPRATSVTAAQPQQFSATVTALANTAVTWSVDGVAGGNASAGTISAGGLYTPGSAEGLHTVTAVSVADGTTTGTATIAVTFSTGVHTFHNDNARTGQNRREFALTPTTVNATDFGKRFSCLVDGQVYAQPLYVADLAIGGGTHNAIFVATEHDSVYAFDADESPCVQYWKTSFLGLGVSPGIPVDTGETGDLRPEIGITGTPVIDPSTNTLYVVAKTKESGNYVQRLHALDLATGAEKFGGPVQIQAQVAGTGTGTSAGLITFDPLIENQRAALLLSNGIVYVAWGSHGDHGNYHGWILGYDAATLALVRSYSPSANGEGTGIWMSGGGPAVDAVGNLYVNTGDGLFTASGGPGAINPPNDSLGDSIIKISTSSTLSPIDYFTPHTQNALNVNDYDLGSSGVVVIPDGLGPPGKPNLVVGGGKEGLLYVLDRNHMGRYTNNGPDDVVQTITVPGGNCGTCGIYGVPALWQDGASTAYLYFGGVDQTLRAYRFVNGLLPTTADSETPHNYAFPSTTPAVSSNGSTNGVVWALETSSNGSGLPVGNSLGPAILRAYSATNLTQVLFSSANGSANTCGNAVKFTTPTVMNGKVYVGGYDRVTVYGLLP